MLSQAVCWIVDNFVKCGAFGLMAAGGAILLMLICINGPNPKPRRDTEPEHWGAE